ncbi:MAG: HupE/UreJ family protein [Pseudomonadales bacterium]|nr:HupE/UreJ family protein [Pseudomonadales bacterium]
MRRAVLLLALLLQAPAFAHEVRPAVLQATETVPGVFQVVWKQPVLDDRRLPIEPVFPDTCTPLESAAAERAPGALIQSWPIRCSLREGRIEIARLTGTLTDAMVQIRYLDGTSIDALLRPSGPVLDLDGNAPGVAAYFGLGVEHLLLGIDHLLFLAGLVLFIASPWMLVKTITAFTLAHSITLALAALGYLTLPPGPVEAVIALSIVFLARELMLPEARRSELMRMRPWIMAFAFGLLHGFGFAGALTEIGLPRDQLAPALLLFNLGIEAGQLLVVAVLLCGAWVLARMVARPLTGVATGLTFTVGALAAFWTIDRVTALL